MGPLRKKAWWRKILLSRLTLGLLILATFALSFAVYDRYEVEREMAARRETAAEELKRESDRQAVLKDRVNYLNNDQGMEAEIRRHFDVALEGEQVVVIVDGGDESNVTALSAEFKEQESSGFWERWWPW